MTHNVPEEWANKPGSPFTFVNGSIDPTNIDGLAGKYRAGYGTPFDLSSVGLSRATHVRLIDVVGDSTAHDTTGDIIYDPHPTGGSAGFDLDAVGVIHEDASKDLDRVRGSPLAAIRPPAASSYFAPPLRRTLREPAASDQ